MRTHQWRTLALAATLGMGAVGAQAALQGRDLDGNAATFEAYYDTTQNISWLVDADAQRAAVHWTEAVVFLNGLNVHGVTGWRLPRTPVLDAACSIQGGSFSGGLGCTGSEIGHLFEVDGISVANPGGFLNLGAIGDSWSADGFIEPQSQNEYKFVYVFIRSFSGIAQPFDSPLTAMGPGLFTTATSATPLWRCPSPAPTP